MFLDLLFDLIVLYNTLFLSYLLHILCFLNK